MFLLLKKYTVFLFMLNMLTACISHTYYLSPNNGVSTPYRPTPLIADSLNTAFYVNGMYTIGAANQSSRDQVSFGQISAHASHNLGHVQASYGALFSLGAYNMAEYYETGSRFYDSTYASPPVYDTTRYIKGKGYFFGTCGFFGSMNLVIPSRKGEWRALGIEANFQREFGNYTAFRKHLSDTSADVIFRKNISGTMGLFTEIIIRKHNGTSFGFKFAGNWVTNPPADYARSLSAGTDIFPLGYFSTTFHGTQGPATFFIQVNLGNLAQSFQCGGSYRFAKIKKHQTHEVR